ncbi:MAG: hypothetical protein ACIAZJ_26210 [Gimesia chilikensis]|uniref:hypothetical protein n=1 Tax=Gimesia chilikensis TaxID=2605989 RepID=UPI00379FA797
MFENVPSTAEGKTPGILLLQNGSRKDEDLRNFLKSCSGWFEQRCRESDIVCALPEFENYDWASLLQLTNEEREIEKRFSGLCGQQDLFGVNKNRQRIESTLLSRSKSSFDRKDILDMMPEDWSDKKVDRNYEALQVLDENSIWARRTATAGMMICKPAFLEERDELKEMWERLPSTEQPSFPLNRSPVFPAEFLQSLGTHFSDSSVYSQELEQFTRKYDRFCDNWCLMRMISWDLPDPMGPSNDKIPWPFPAHRSDGITDSLIVKSTGIAEEHGFDDQGSWDSYCSIMKIDHWERTINVRYADRPKPRGVTTRLISILSELLGISFDRVKRIRRWKKKLVNGEISSLKGIH